MILPDEIGSQHEERAEQLAPEVGVYIGALFDADDVLSMQRTVQSVVTHLEKFPRERAIVRPTVTGDQRGSRGGVAHDLGPAGNRDLI